MGMYFYNFFSVFFFWYWLTDLQPNYSWCRGVSSLTSPLFTIVAQVLGSLLFRAKDLGFIGGEIISLQFVDNIVQLNSSNWESIANLERIQRYLELVSSLRINLS